jgi:hypothetical protein
MHRAFAEQLWLHLSSQTGQVEGEVGWEAVHFQLSLAIQTQDHKRRAEIRTVSTMFIFGNKLHHFNITWSRRRDTRWTAKWGKICIRTAVNHNRYTKIRRTINDHDLYAGECMGQATPIWYSTSLMIRNCSWQTLLMVMNSSDRWSSTT